MPANHCGRRSPTNDAASPASAAPVRRSRGEHDVEGRMRPCAQRCRRTVLAEPARPVEPGAGPTLCRVVDLLGAAEAVDQVVRERRRLPRHCDPHLGARCDVLDDALELRAVEDTVGDLGREAARNGAVGKSSNLVVERRRDRVLELREETISATTRSTTRCSASERATASGSEPASALSTVRSSSGAEARHRPQPPGCDDRPRVRPSLPTQASRSCGSPPS